jgi:hypothetical protein
MANYSPGIIRARSPTNGGGGSAPSGGGGQNYSGNGLPSVTPTTPTDAATFESLDLNLFFDWDTNSLKWRSRGAVQETTILNLPANAWTRLPPTTLLTRIDSYRTFRASDEMEVDSFANRISPIDGWPEIESANPYTGLIVRCIGSIVI